MKRGLFRSDYKENIQYYDVPVGSSEARGGVALLQLCAAHIDTTTLPDVLR